MYQFLNRVDILVILKENHLGVGGWEAVVQSVVTVNKVNTRGGGCTSPQLTPIRTGCALFDVSLCYFGAPPVGTPLIPLCDYDEGSKKAYLLFSLSC